MDKLLSMQDDCKVQAKTENPQYRSLLQQVSIRDYRYHSHRAQMPCCAGTVLAQQDWNSKDGSDIIGSGSGTWAQVAILETAEINWRQLSD